MSCEIVCDAVTDQRMSFMSFHVLSSGSIDPTMVTTATRFDVMRAAVLICARVTLIGMWNTWMAKQTEKILEKVKRG